MANQCVKFHSLLVAFLLANLNVSAKDCVGKVQDTEWCVEGIKIENYRFPSRDSNIELDLNIYPFVLAGKSRFIAKIPLRNITVKIDKKLSEDLVTIAGYSFPVNYSYPWMAIIFVADKEKKKEIEDQIKAAKERFVQNCFGCKELGIQDLGSGSSKKR